MRREYWNAQTQIINLLRDNCGQILTLNIDDESMTIITPFIDEEIIPDLRKICADKLCYVYKPHTIDTRVQTKYQKKRGSIKPSVLWKFFVQ